ncbi:MAG: NUDIX domain-containing protein [Solirubrobacteraceae bacterium]|nr:NUDIX domain-containing protein [Solirubrobacteraceae bacterium]
MDPGENGGLRGPFVGTSAIVVRDGLVLMGRRRGAVGAGEWAFPGGAVDPGEDPAATAARELLEETGLIATTVAPAVWTSATFPDAGTHWITLHHRIEASGEPLRTEPDKVEGWTWVRWDALPRPLFAPVVELLAMGWAP